MILERSGGGPGKPVGRVALIDGLGTVYCNNFCQQLRVDEEQWIPQFATRALWYRYTQGVTARLEHQTTGIRNLDYAAYLNLPILLPPLLEQRAIAVVLDSIDDAIERTEAVITATEQLRDSLLHELLTLGIPGWHTVWREALGIGTIPEDWDVVRLGEVATLQRGADLPVQNRLPGLVPVYGSNGILDRHTQALANGPGVITGRSGSIGLVYFSSEPYWPLNTTLYVSDFHGNSERFVYYFLSQMRLDRFAASTGVPSLNRNFVHPLKVACPSLSEQMAIATMLDGVGAAVQRAREERDGLQSLKASIADALLTGRVRMSKSGDEPCRTST